MCERVRVLTGDRIGQDEFQHFVVGKVLQSIFRKPAAQPLPMSGVYIGFGFVHAEALLPVRILSATSIKNSFAIDNRRAGRI